LPEDKISSTQVWARWHGTGQERQNVVQTGQQSRQTRLFEQQNYEIMQIQTTTPVHHGND